MLWINTPDKIRALGGLSPQEIQIKLDAITIALPHFIKNEIGDRIRRGKLHDLIFKTLKLKRTNAHYYLIKAALAAYGIDEITIDGKYFYAGPPRKVYGPRKRIIKERQDQSFSQKS